MAASRQIDQSSGNANSPPPRPLSGLAMMELRQYQQLRILNPLLLERCPSVHCALHPPRSAHPHAHDSNGVIVFPGVLCICGVACDACLNLTWSPCQHWHHPDLDLVNTGIIPIWIALAPHPLGLENGFVRGTSPTWER